MTQQERESMGFGKRGRVPHLQRDSAGPRMTQQERESMRLGLRGPVPNLQRDPPKTQMSQEERESMGFGLRGPVPNLQRDPPETQMSQEERESMGFGLRGPVPNLQRDPPETQPKRLERESMGFGLRGPVPNLQRDPPETQMSQEERESMGFGLRGPVPNLQRDPPETQMSQEERESMGFGLRGPVPNLQRDPPETQMSQEERESMGFGLRGPVPNLQRDPPETQMSQEERESMGFGLRGPVPNLQRDPPETQMSQEERESMGFGLRGPVPNLQRDPPETQMSQEERESMGFGLRGPVPNLQRDPPETQMSQEERESMGFGLRGPVPNLQRDPPETQMSQEERESMGFGLRGPVPNLQRDPPETQMSQEERESMGFGLRGPVPNLQRDPPETQMSQEERESMGFGLRGPVPNLQRDPPETQPKRLERESLGFGTRGMHPTYQTDDRQPINSQQERDAFSFGRRGFPANPNPEKTRPSHSGKSVQTMSVKYMRRIIANLPKGQTESGILTKQDYQKLAGSNPEDFMLHFYTARNGIIREWTKYGLSEICSGCHMLTPGRQIMRKRSQPKHDSENKFCKNCREKKTDFVLQQVPKQSKWLRKLSYIEQRLIAMAQVSQFLIDMPSAGPRGQWGRMYITALQRPRLSAVLENCRIDKTGNIYVHSPNGQIASPANVRNLYRALEELHARHKLYRTREVQETIQRLQQKAQIKWSKAKARRIAKARSQRCTERQTPEMPQQDPPHPITVLTDDEEGAPRLNRNKPEKPTIDSNKKDAFPKNVSDGDDIEFTFPEAPAAPFAETEDLEHHRFMANLMTNADVKVFPHLFPTGQYGYDPNMKFYSYIRQRLLGADDRFERCPDYIYFLLETWLKKRISSNTSVRIAQQRHNCSDTTPDALRRQVYTTLRDVPGTQPYVYAKKGIALNMYAQLGAPQWFLTLTCHAKQRYILLACIYAKLLRQEHHTNQIRTKQDRRREAAAIYAEYLRDEKYTWDPDELSQSKKPKQSETNEKKERRGFTANELCSSMPAVLARQFFHQVKKFLRWLAPAAKNDQTDADEHETNASDQESSSASTSADEKQQESESSESLDQVSDVDAPTTTKQQPKPKRYKWPPPFRTTDYIVRVEWQKRGYPHVHILLWTDAKAAPDAPDHELTEEDLDHLTDDDVAGKIHPKTVEDLTDKFVSTTSPARWNNIHQKRKPDNAEYKCLGQLAKIQIHHCNQYCRRYAAGSQYCRFGFPHAPEKRARRRSAKEQWSQRVKSSIAVRRHPGLRDKPDDVNGEGRHMAQYNKRILFEWQSSMDLQPICELTMASRYILGYTFKSEEDQNAAKRVENLLQQFQEHKQQLHQATYKIAHAATQARTTSTFEACHLLLGFPVVFFSRDSVWVQVGRPQTWTLWVPRHHEKQALGNPEKYANQHGDQLPAAQARYSHVQQFLADHSTIIPVQNGDSHTSSRHLWRDISFFDFCAGFHQRGQSIEHYQPVPRTKPAIVGHRNFSPDTETEDYFYSKLMLHLPWTEPGDWLKPEDLNSHTRAFHRIASDTHHYPNFMTSICYPALNNTVQAAKEIQRVQATMYLKASIRSNLRGWTLSRFEQDKYRDSLRIMQSLQERHGKIIEFDTPDTAPSGMPSDIYAPVECGEDHPPAPPLPHPPLPPPPPPTPPPPPPPPTPPLRR